MKPHKWAKEIKAWADGAEIEWRFFIDNIDSDWTKWHSVNKPPLKWNSKLKGEYKFNGDFSTFNDDKFELRIKPQPKEPQYLYVYKDTIDENGNSTTLVKISTVKLNIDRYIGKIKLEQDE